jgi:hypothetical protein
LHEAIKAYALEDNKRLEAIAKAHSVSVAKIKGIIGIETHYKKSQRPALPNAILHAKALEINNGRSLSWCLSEVVLIIRSTDLEPGQKAKLVKLKALAADDLENLMEDQKEALIQQLMEYHNSKTTSTHANNAAAACDVLCTSDAMIKEVSGYHMLILASSSSLLFLSSTT